MNNHGIQSITTLGGGSYNITDTTGYTTYINFPSYYTTTTPQVQIYDIFTTFNKTFNSNLTQEQIDFLDSLYNSGEENNKILACEMFKSIINGKQ